MISVDMIGQIRRAYFERSRPIKEIVRTLRVSRATVRKVIRGQKTEFKYERGVQPAPKLGEWVEVLTEILEHGSSRSCRSVSLTEQRAPIVSRTMPSTIPAANEPSGVQPHLLNRTPGPFFWDLRRDPKPGLPPRRPMPRNGDRLSIACRHVARRRK
jgi:hypothetical protein